ncbi:hypothetical protein GCM10027515_13890 [Schumannella luteola]|jgi:hypothetical protein|uniref:DoxX family protein n=1 Tax=Schumannella luteola TaxID=472059 RepID=A0A852YKW6_9MICO|nr:DoxX family protein [Schumannella luteola]NYG97835.1 hypothetical protein [Schumannella luteola]TPX02905.1 DoxX family protein [Schumannella luteola]
MSIFVWVISGLLCLAYLAAGGFKTFGPDARIYAAFPWAKQVGMASTRIIGALELLGALGLILPVLLGMAQILTPIAALGLVAVQIAAMTFHIQRREFQALPVNVVMLLLAAVIAVLRFLGY